MPERVVSSYHSPRIQIPMNWGTNGTVWVGDGGGANPFSTTATDPNTNKFPVEYATGRAGIDGNMTIALEGGFTPSVTLTIWEFNRTANAWFKIGPSSANYSVAVDATYAMASFQTSENAYVLVQTDSAVTGTCFMDATIDFTSVKQRGEGI